MVLGLAAYGRRYCQWRLKLVATYLVESAAEQLIHHGRACNGIPAEGYNFYLHLLDLQPDEVSNLVVIVNRYGRPITGRRAPTADSKWWFVYGSPKAFWPGRSRFALAFKVARPLHSDRS